MGYMMAMAGCCCCKLPFSFNPDLVPSVVIDGVRQPICRDCVVRANPERKKRGLAVISILPGAYDPQAVDE